MTEEQIKRITEMVKLGEQFTEAMQSALEICIEEPAWNPLIPDSMFDAGRTRNALVYWRGFLMGHKANEPA